jgi:hypothetical protein
MFYVLQVFKEASTYRGKMKDICEKMFLRYYGDMLGVNKFIESQVAYQDNIASNVQELIGKPSLFHYVLKLKGMCEPRHVIQQIGTNSVVVVRVSLYRQRAEL